MQNPSFQNRIASYYHSSINSGDAYPKLKGRLKTDTCIIGGGLSGLCTALPLAEALFEPGLKYLKAGVILGELVPDDSIQGNLFIEKAHNQYRYLMDVIDNINFSQRDDAVKYAASGLEPVANTPAEFGAYIRREAERNAKVIKEAGIKLD